MNEPTAAETGNGAATEAVERVKDFFQERDFDEVVTDLKELAKRHPGAVLLTAAAVGFMLARSLRH